MKQKCLSTTLLLLCPLGVLSPCTPAWAKEPAGSKTVKVYKAGKYVIPPELLPVHFTTSADPACQSPLNGEAQFAEIVDPTGTPLSIFSTRPTGNSMDQLAVQIAERDRFKPGQKNGISVAVSITINIQLEACPVNEKDANGNTISNMKLVKQPVQQVGPATGFEPEELPAAGDAPETGSRAAAADPLRIAGSVTPPVPIYTPEAKFTAEARKKDIQGICLVSLIVDAYGMPQNIRVVKSLGYGLDEAAIEAVQRYRFRPATKEHRPVPVMMSIEVNFRLR